MNHIIIITYPHAHDDVAHYNTKAVATYREQRHLPR